MINKKLTHILFILSIFIVSTCLFIAVYSTGDKSTTSYLKGSGSYWDVELKTENGKLQSKLIFTYKDDINDLKKIKRISFLKGDAYISQIVTIGDNSYKEDLKNKGLYQEEFNSKYNISFIEFNKLSTKKFTIDFSNPNDNLVNSGKGPDVSKMLIEINWYQSFDNTLAYKDTIHIDP